MMAAAGARRRRPQSASTRPTARAHRSPPAEDGRHTPGSGTRARARPRAATAPSGATARACGRTSRSKFDPMMRYDESPKSALSATRGQCREGGRSCNFTPSCLPSVGRETRRAGTLCMVSGGRHGFVTCVFPPNSATHKPAPLRPTSCLCYQHLRQRSRLPALPCGASKAGGPVIMVRVAASRLGRASAHGGGPKTRQCRQQRAPIPFKQCGSPQERQPRMRKSARTHRHPRGAANSTMDVGARIAHEEFSDRTHLVFLRV